ncbi:MAG TPA: hypothetical protein DCQ50_09610 [Chryseobacterium sp.]|nr:hypothetical protein [Chryseobacterium sp.]
MTPEIIAEIRNWTLLLIGTIGAIITLKSFVANNRQRRIENTYKTIEYLRKHISAEQINTFIELYQANNPLGVPGNEFHLKNGEIDTIENMFSEGGCGNGNIHNMIEVFNLISKSLIKHDLEEELIWYEYGQLMLTCYKWTYYLEINKTKGVDLSKREEMNDKEYKAFLGMWHDQLTGMNRFFYDFNLYMKKAIIKLSDRPMKYYTYAE